MSTVDREAVVQLCADPLPATRMFSAQAVACVLGKSLPEDGDVWEETLTLVSQLVGVDVTSRTHDLLMREPKVTSLFRAACEELTAQLTKAFPCATERKAVLASGAAIAVRVPAR